MSYEMNCVFKHDIDEELRRQLAEGKLSGGNASAASWCELRGIAVLELGYLDIELNINTLDRECNDLEETAPLCDYFICTKYGDGRDEWESFGYADDFIGDAGTAHVDWSAENWEELLFSDMLQALCRFAAHMNGSRDASDSLTFHRANSRVF